MGMFDCYEPVPALTCPKCGLPLDGWQGKGGPCLLLTWKQGQAEPPPHPSELDRDRLEDGEFGIYTQCQGKPNACGSWIDADIVVKDGVWQETRIALVREGEP